MPEREELMGIAPKLAMVTPQKNQKASCRHAKFLHLFFGLVEMRGLPVWRARRLIRSKWWWSDPNQPGIKKLVWFWWRYKFTLEIGSSLFP